MNKESVSAFLKAREMLRRINDMHETLEDTLLLLLRHPDATEEQITTARLLCVDLHRRVEAARAAVQAKFGTTSLRGLFSRNRPTQPKE